MTNFLPDRRHFLSGALAAATLGAAPPVGPPRVLWQLDLNSASYGGGAVGDLEQNGQLSIVFGTYFNDEHLYCVDARTGKPRWTFRSEGGPWDASVALADLDGDGKLEILAADSSTGTLFCLNPQGRLIWKYRLPSSTDSPPAVADLDGDGKPEVVVGTMTTADRHGRVVCLDPMTQKPRWTARVPGHVQSEPVLIDLDGDGHLDVVVTTWRGDQSVHALHGRTGKELWSSAMKGDMYHGVTAFDHRGVLMLAASIKGDVALFDNRGRPLWVRQPGGYLFGPTCVADLDGDGTPELVVVGPQVIVYDLLGRERWRSKPYGGINRGCALADIDGDGRLELLFGATDRRFRALDGATGVEQWAFDATVQGHAYEWLDGAPLVADFDGDGQLELFFVAGKGTSDRTRKANYGRAYALKLGKGRSPWPMFRGNLRRTGTPG
ncbi:MAG: FG-GAP-like repeat-containing protein [Gemmataceae bacterium]